MRLEPVYLLAPEPEPSPKPQYSRRAVIAAAGGGFVMGAVAGVTGLLSPATQRSSSSTDESLAWALQLQDGPLETIVLAADAFLARYVAFADPRLETGVIRLTSALADDSLVQPAARGELARKLIAVIQSNESASSELRELLPSLRALR